MMRILCSQNSSSAQCGFTLTEMLVAMGLGALVMLGAIQQFTQSTQLSHDHSVRIATTLEAQAILQSIGSEIRMIGNGVPFEQANFQIGEITLTDPTKTEPLDPLTATATNLTFRINETGDVYLLTANFDPSATTTISLTDVSNLDVNDPIYISNSVVSEEDGLYGVVTAVNSGANTITIDPAYVASPGSTFGMGSILEEVPQVTYASSGNTITRDSGFGPVVMGQNTTMNLDYLDPNGNTLALPLTNAMVVSSLRAIRVTIAHTGNSNLRSGQPYTVTLSQTFGVRNLNYAF